MTSEEEVERQIRRALMVKAARVHLRHEQQWLEPVAQPHLLRREPEGRRWQRRPWELALLPAIAALVTAIVVLGTGHVPASQSVGGPSAAATTGVVISGTNTPPVRSAAGGVVLAGQGGGQQSADGNPVTSAAPRTCDVWLAPTLAHGLRSPNCLE